MGHWKVEIVDQDTKVSTLMTEEHKSRGDAEAAAALWFRKGSRPTLNKLGMSFGVWVLENIQQNSKEIYIVDSYGKKHKYEYSTTIEGEIIAKDGRDIIFRGIDGWSENFTTNTKVKVGDKGNVIQLGCQKTFYPKEV